MPTEVLEVTKKFMREPVRILVKKEELTLEGIKQFYINVEREVNTDHQDHVVHGIRLCPRSRLDSGNLYLRTAAVNHKDCPVINPGTFIHERLCST